MKTIYSIIVWIFSWCISALILYPCLILSAITYVFKRKKVDYHYQFHLWWGDKVLNDLT